ncbi:MAG: adenylosuccinate lyase [Bacteroidia bacterium]|nr:adenylosuccinate lyase [Bacteroidia bacterium]
MTELNTLNAISPVDGRYFDKCKELVDFFSEAALMKYRVKVEAEYFIALTKLPISQLKGFDSKKIKSLRNIYLDFDENDVRRIKQIEQTTNHDVKAVEYFIREKFDETGFENLKEFIHFGLTSQDMNNTAIPLMVKEAMQKIYLPLLNDFKKKLEQKAESWKNIAMLAHTHGQPASPTCLGKEMYVFSVRIDEQIKLLNQIPNTGKFGGATGNFNAHYAAYPEIDWNRFAESFLKSLGLQRSYPTTQIEHYDHFAALCDNLKRINNILIDFSRDMWSYISMNYFRQEVIEGEVGSSAMPHKVNPIDFENAEANFGMANAVFEFLSSKLPISRLQRDLTDSSVLRNAGVPFAHTVIALKSLIKGLGKVTPDTDTITFDMDNNWAVTAEAIQTVLRRENYPDPYNALKALTRKNKKITQKEIQAFIDSLDVKASVKKELKAITPFNYTGIPYKPKK